MVHNILTEYTESPVQDQPLINAHDCIRLPGRERDRTITLETPPVCLYDLGAARGMTV